MTDRELIEAAAKAAGYPVEHLKNRGFMMTAGPHQGDWNPLKDDGDALRLVVPLRITIEMHRDFVMARAKNRFTGNLIDVRETFGDSANAATRRAIVRAAAAMAQQPQGSNT